MTQLFDIIKSKIITEGPIRVSEYMADALCHIQHGYYRKGQPIGLQGDFITAPEISQIFGELLGLWSVRCWQQIKSPEKFNLVELGPGRGTLISDILRASRAIPRYLDALNLHLVETNITLAAVQKNLLLRQGIQARWHESFVNIPDGQFILIANEFLDSLPIRQFIKTETGWCERLVDLSENGECLLWKNDSTSTEENLLCVPRNLENKVGAILEVCVPAQTLIKSISYSILKTKSVAIFIDYGYLKSDGSSTFQAVSQHKYAAPLEKPGQIDLTAHVDFGAIRRIAEYVGVRVSGPITQREFLLSLGVEQRADRLIVNSTLKQQEEIVSGFRRLIENDQMGELFKVIVLSHPESPLPEGF